MMKAFQVLGILVAIALIIFAVAFPTPEKRIRVSEYGWDKPWHDEYGEEYVGGDAYNYQMEASLKAGYMSGVLAMKSITFVGGLLLFFTSVYSCIRCKIIEAQTSLLVKLTDETANHEKTFRQMKEESERQSAILQNICTMLENSVKPDEDAAEPADLMN